MLATHHRHVPFVPLVLAALAACQESSTPTDTVAPQFGVQPNKGVWTVTSLADPGTGSCTSDVCTLRQAVAAAVDGDKIVFKGSVSGVIALEEPLTIDRDITIDGGNRVTLDSQSGRVIKVNSEAEATLVGLVITGGATGNGGGILNDGNLTIKSSRITGNEAFVVGGGISSNGVLTILNSTVDENHSQEEAGGINSSGSLTIRGSAITGNSAIGFGAGIYSSGDALITETTISGNILSRTDFESRGGGIYTRGVRMQIRNSTIILNESNASSGFGAGVWADGPTTFANTIVAANDSDEGDDECSSSNVVSLGHNLTRTGGDGCPFDTSTDVRLALAAIFTEVLEQALKDNGGPTKTHALIQRGRAVDVGYCPGVNTDQRGQARPYDEPLLTNVADGCDIGAFEWRPLATKPGKGR